MRLSAEEERMLHALADRRGVSASDLLRLTIRQMYESEPAFREPPQKRTKR